MIARDRRRSVAVLMALAVSAAARGQVNVTTYHNDNARTGQNTHERILSPANVNSSQFGRLFTVAVDGSVYAQPLYLSAVRIGGGVHNVLYVATQHDSIYALDADSGAVYWQDSLIPPGGRPVSSTDFVQSCSDIAPEIGITGTPVIDPASQTIYLVAKTYLQGSYFQYLHALDVATGAEKFGGPVEIQGSVPGNGYDAVSGSVAFNALQENQRPALLLEGGHVVIGWSAHCDIDPWHGWLMSYSASTLVRLAIFSTSANSRQAGIWMSGGGPAADSGGNIFFATGNGPWDGVTSFASSVVKVGPPSGGSFPVLDFFTPYDQAILGAFDRDVGSGGTVLLPTLPSGRQLLAAAGKPGTIYVLDRSDMGKYCVTQTPACTASDPQIAQEIVGANAGTYGSPAYWNGHLYLSGQNDHMKSYSFNTKSGAVSYVPTSETPEYFGYPAPTPSVSSNGGGAGIVWGIDPSAYLARCDAATDCQVLYAYDATNLSNLLYSSSQAAGARDVPGSAVKGATPTIANGKVYVGSRNGVSAFGLLDTAPVSVDLSAVANVYGLGTSGVEVTLGGADGHGNAYAANLFGPSVEWSGLNFTMIHAGPASAVANAAVPLPPRNAALLSVLAAGVDGSRANQVLGVKYTDGTAAEFTQSLSDWHAPQNFPGESIAFATAYRIRASGKTQAGTYYIYGYSFPLDPTRTVESLVLPATRDVVVLSAELTPAPAVAASASRPAAREN